MEINQNPLGTQKHLLCQSQYLMELTSAIVKPEDLLLNERIIYDTNSIPGKNLEIQVSHDFRTEYLHIPRKLKKSANVFKDLFKNIQISIVITNYRIIIEPSFSIKHGKEFEYFFSKQPSFIRQYFEIPLGQVLRCEKQLNPVLDQDQQKYGFVSHLAYQNQLDNYIEIYTRDSRHFKIKFHISQVSECKKIHGLINKNCFYDSTYYSLNKSFTYHFRINVKSQQIPGYRNGWDLPCDILDEVKRQGVDISSSNHFKVLDNSRFDICATYPQTLIVPKSMSNEQIKQCSRFRTKNRLPALTYYYKKNGCSIWRASQTQNGIRNTVNSQDELMLAQIAKTNMTNDKAKLHIFDARPYLNAQANRLKGGGFEDTRYYPNTDLTFCDIDNIHAVTKVFNKLQDIPNSPEVFNSMESYGSKVEDSGYLQLLSVILKSCNQIVDTIIKGQQNVLIHCSDGWDRTSQLCALVQLMLDPYYRTLEGFIILIEKDWLSFGHQFHVRFGQYSRNWKESQRSPVFIQFLDCVHQILLQFPSHFEFNCDLLYYVATEINNQKYGTFLGNCPKDRLSFKLVEDTESMWTFVLMDKLRFLNINFDQYLPDKDLVIKEIPQVKYQLLQEWRQFFYRWCEFGNARNLFQQRESTTELKPFRYGVMKDNKIITQQNQFNVDLQFEKKEVKREDPNQFVVINKNDYIGIQMPQNQGEKNDEQPYDTSINSNQQRFYLE